MQNSTFFLRNLPRKLGQGTAFGLIVMMAGTTGSLCGQRTVSIDDRESYSLSMDFSGIVANSVGAQLDAYDGSGPDYWNGVQKITRLPATGLTYGQDHGAAGRSPWSVTTSLGSQISFSITGQVSRMLNYERHSINEWGDEIVDGATVNAPYDLNVDFEEVLALSNSAGRTGVAGKITAITGSVQYNTGASTHTGYEFSYFGWSGQLGLAANGQHGIHDSAQPGPTTGAFNLSFDPAAHDPSSSEILFNPTLTNNSPLIYLGGISAHLSAGQKAGEITSSAQLSIQGNFSYTFEEANQEGEFIFTGADVLARDYFNPENWSKRMTPGLVDRVQFNHADSKEVDFGYYGYPGIEDNRMLHVSNGGTTTVDLGAVAYPISWRLGKNFSDIDELPLQVDAGKLIIKGGLLDIVGSATLAAGAGQVSALEVETGGQVKFTNRVSAETFEIAPSVLRVGQNGRGTLTIRNGGALTADVIIAGESAGSTGEIVVSGTGSQLHASGLIVGQLGQGEFTVQNGGKAMLSNFVVGGGAGLQGQVTVRNTGSELMMESGSLVGGENGGRGRLEVLAGGALRGSPEAGSSIVLGIGGGNPAQSSTVLVSGSGSTLANLGVAVRAGGLLHVRDGASWTSGGGESNLLIGGGEVIFQNTATVNLNSIEVNSVYREGVLTPDGLIASGRLNVLSGAVVSVADTLAIGAGAQVNVNGTGARIEGLEYGRIVGSLNVSNGGQVLAGQQGRIIVENGGVISGSGGVIAFQPKTDASGDFIPYVQVQAGGTIRPGNSPGTLTITGDVRFEAGSTLQLEIGGVTPGSLYDQLVVSGNASFAEGSMLEFAFTNGYAPTVGQTFSFFDVGGTLNFNTALASFSVIGLEAGWDYETSVIAGGFALKSLSNGVATTPAIPEPSTYAAMAGAVAFGITVWRRRRIRVI